MARLSAAALALGVLAALLASPSASTAFTLLEFRQNILAGAPHPRWAPDYAAGLGAPGLLGVPPLAYYVALALGLPGLGLLGGLKAGAALAVGLGTVSAGTYRRGLAFGLLWGIVVAGAAAFAPSPGTALALGLAPLMLVVLRSAPLAAGLVGAGVFLADPFVAALLAIAASLGAPRRRMILVVALAVLLSAFFWLAAVADDPGPPPRLPPGLPALERDRDVTPEALRELQRIAGTPDPPPRVATSAGLFAQTIARTALYEELVVEAAGAGTLSLGLNRASEWSIKVDGVEVRPGQGSDGTLTLPLEAGSHQVVVTQRRSVAGMVGEFVSLGTLAALLMLATWRLAASASLRGGGAWRGKTALLAAIVVGFAARMYDIGRQSLWYDEAGSLFMAAPPLVEVAGRTAADVHPPLYFYLLHGWIALVGADEFGLRTLSALTSTAVIPVIAVIGRRAGGWRLGLAAAALAALSPFLVYYGQEGRMYALLALEAAIATYLLLRLVETPGPGRSAAYGAAALSIVYTHYYGPPLLAAHGLALLALRPPRRVWSGWVSACVVSGLLFVPWLGATLPVYSSMARSLGGGATFGDVVGRTVTAFATGHSVERVVAGPGDPGYFADHLFATVLGLPLAALGIIGAAGLRRSRAGAVLISALVGSTLVLYLLLAVGGRDFTARYLTAAIPAYVLLVAAGLLVLWRVHRVTGLIAFAATLLIAGFALRNMYVEPRFERDDFRGVIEFVAERQRPDQIVVVNAPYARLPVEHYVRGRWPTHGLPATYPPDAAATTRAVADLVTGRPFVWLVLWQDYYSDPSRIVEKWLGENAWRVDERRFRGGIRVVGFRTRHPIGDPMPPRHLVQARLSDAVSLVGYDLEPAALSGGEEVRLRLVWQTEAPLARGYHVFVHMVDSSGRLHAQRDGPPADGRAPTDTWPRGVPVSDEHRLRVPALVPAGDYRLLVGLYDPVTLARMGGAGYEPIALPLELRSGGRGLPTAAVIDDVHIGTVARLRAHEAPGAARAGRALPLTLYWEPLRTVERSLTVFVHLVDERGQIVAQADGPPPAATTRWPVGDVFRDDRAVVLPAGLAPGVFSLRIGLYDPASGSRLPVGRGDAYEVRRIVVGP